MIKVLYWLAAAGWIVHLVYWFFYNKLLKKGKVSGEDLFNLILPDYTAAVLSLIMLCLLGAYGIYFGGL